MASLESGLLTTDYYYDDDVMTLFGLNRQSCCCCSSIRRRIRAKVQSLRVISSTSYCYNIDVVIYYCDVLFRLLHPTVLLEAFEHQQIKFDIDNTHPPIHWQLQLAVLAKCLCNDEKIATFWIYRFFALTLPREYVSV